jgi:hypothetical protein
MEVLTMSAASWYEGDGGWCRVADPVESGTFFRMDVRNFPFSVSGPNRTVTRRYNDCRTSLMRS